MKNITKVNTIWVLLIAMIGFLLLTFGTADTIFGQTPSEEACAALGELGTGAACGTSGDRSQVSSLAGDIISFMSYLVGILSVIMIIIGGFRFLTSGGDAGKTASARNTIVYALVGLIVAIFAQVIVAFVITETTTDTGAGFITPTNLV